MHSFPGSDKGATRGLTEEANHGVLHWVMRGLPPPADAPVPRGLDGQSPLNYTVSFLSASATEGFNCGGLFGVPSPTSTSIWLVHSLAQRSYERYIEGKAQPSEEAGDIIERRQEAAGGCLVLATEHPESHSVLKHSY